MIVVDTNVISEVMRSHPSPIAENWLNNQSPESLYLSVTSLTELQMGLAVMPQGKRRDALNSHMREFLVQLFGARVLPVSIETADFHAQCFALARSKGVTISFADAQIAAIAKAHGFAVATRDVAPFVAAGLEVINPWQGGQ